MQIYERAVFERVSITMRDGTQLKASLARPGGHVVPRPTVLVRTPYGSKGQEETALLYCERNLNYMLQDTRGRFESGGDFFPVKNEKCDGEDTVAWIKQQPWSDGRVGVHGISYMGMTSFATAGCGESAVRVAVPCMASSQIFSIAFPAEGAVALELLVLWTFIIVEMQRKNAITGWYVLEACLGFRGYAARKVEQITGPGCVTLPLRDVDQVIVGQRVGYMQDGLSNPDKNLPFWESRNYLADLRFKESVPAALHMIGGWFDFFLPQQLQDLKDARAHGCDARITIGPWHHWDVLNFYGPALRITMGEYKEHLFIGSPNDKRPPPCAPVASVCLMGSNEWRGYAEWPPPSTPTTLWLTHQGHLSIDAPQPCHDDEVSSSMYDPSRPTPALGGAAFNPFNAGRRDCRPLSSRSDVLTFNIASPLTEPLDVVGVPIAQIGFSSDTPTADLVLRLCDVHPNGKSLNVCDGYVRLTASDKASVVTVNFTGTAYRFNTGHRIQLLVCSSAHPRVSRNLGTLESLSDGKRMVAGTMRVHHGGKLRSSLSLPLCDGEWWPIPAP